MFWREKVAANQRRDESALQRLADMGWRVGIVWECALKGRGRRALEEVLETCEEWLRSSDPGLEIEGFELRPPV